MHLLVLLALVASSWASVTITPWNLLVEHISTPLNIATLTPRFSWQLYAPASAHTHTAFAHSHSATTSTPSSGDSPRNVTQVAYQIQVASSLALLEDGEGTADVWDSGRVVSRASVLVEYGGSTPLVPGQLYYWRVRAWIQATVGNVSISDSPTNYSLPARFGVGLQTRADWSQNASFIGMASAANTECPWFRKVFTLSTQELAALSAGEASALLHVASVGYHEAYVNGAKLRNTSVLVPSVSYLAKRVFSHTYDITETGNLVAGDNVLGIWIAPGWALFEGVNPVMDFNISKAPLVLAELRIQPAAAFFTGDKSSADKRDERKSSTLNQAIDPRYIFTDSSWKCTLSSTSHLGRWTNSDFGGDHLNYTRDIPGWSTTAVSDATWEAATPYSFMDSRIVTPDIAEPTGILGSVPAVSVAPCGTGCFLVTMAELYTGWFSISQIPARPGATVTFQYSTNEGTVVEYNMVDAVTLSPSQNPPSGASFTGRFSYHEIQYVTILGLSAAPDLGSMIGLRLMNARPRSGSFQSSNPLLDAIYNATVRTYEGLTTGGMTVDCPHRERLGYGGDGHTSMELAMATFASGAFFSKVAQDWGDVQGWDGPSDLNLPHTAPTIDGGGGPGWGGYIVNMPWRLYLTTGDPRPLQSAFPHITQFLTSLLSYVDTESGLMQPFGGSWGFLGDWLTPHGSEDSGTPESVLFNNCYLVYCLRLAAKIATVLGDTSQAQSYLTAAVNLGAAIHAKFFVNTTSSYLDTRQTHQVMPLIAGVVPPGLVPSVMAALEREIVGTQSGHVDTGLHGTYFMAKLLSDPSFDRNDLLYLMATQTTAPSYGDMLAKGYTTWPEEWGGAPSRMHGCLNGFGLWFNQGILGVRANESWPGLQVVSIQPSYTVGDLQWAQGSTLTPYGTLTNFWTASPNGKNFTHTLSIPMNAGAFLWIPANDPSHVFESGLPASSSPGVSFQRQDGNMTVWSLGSGDFNFTSWV